MKCTVNTNSHDIKVTYAFEWIASHGNLGIHTYDVNIVKATFRPAVHGMIFHKKEA
jgi:hypothetical protein